jgi:hypothetical protein
MNDITTKFEECYELLNKHLEATFQQIVKEEAPGVKLHSVVFESDDNKQGKFYVSVYTQPKMDPMDPQIFNAEKRIRDYVMTNMNAPLRYFFAPSFDHTFTYIR